MLQFAHDRHFPFDILSLLFVDCGYEFCGQLFARLLLCALVDDTEFTFESEARRQKEEKLKRALLLWPIRCQVGVS